MLSLIYICVNCINKISGWVVQDGLNEIELFTASDMNIPGGVAYKNVNTPWNNYSVYFLTFEAS